MAGVNGDRKGKKDDNGLGSAIDFVLSNAKLVLGVGGAAMLGIATLAVKRVRESVSARECTCIQHGSLIAQSVGSEGSIVLIFSGDLYLTIFINCCRLHAPEAA